MRMMAACKSRPDIDIKEAVGTYEFSVAPRSLFAANALVLLQKCLDESFVNELWSYLYMYMKTTLVSIRMRVSVVDAMAEVQCLLTVDKPGWGKNCSHLADHF